MVITQLAAKFPRIVFYSHHLEIQIPTGAYKTSKILKIKIVPRLWFEKKDWLCLLLESIENVY